MEEKLHFIDIVRFWVLKPIIFTFSPKDTITLSI